MRRVWPWPFLALLALVFTWPLARELGQAVNDPVDPLLNTWILAWNSQALLHWPRQLLDANIFYPYSRALLYSETLLLPGMLLTPIQVVWENPILAYNGMVLLGIVGTAWAGYLLGSWATASRWGGLAAGIGLAFNGYMGSVMPKAQLLQFGWTPLALLYLGRMWTRPDRRQGLLLALFLAFQFYTTVYYGLFAFLAVGLVGGLAGVGRIRSLFAAVSTAREGQETGSRLGPLGLGLLVGLGLSLPLGLAYYRLSRELGLYRTLADAWPFSASLAMWATPSPHRLLYRWLPVPELPTVGIYPVEALFPGVVLPALALWGLARGAARGPLRSPGLRWLVAALVAGFFVLSLGPYLQVRSLQPDRGLQLPYAWLHTYLPGFDALRAPVRFAALVYLGLGLLAGCAVSRISSRPVRMLWLALLFLDALSLPGVGRFVPPAPRPVHGWLAEQPPGVVLELPAYFPNVWAQDEADRWLAAQYHSTVHWQTTPAGYSGFAPPRHEALLTLLNRFPAAESVRLLQDLGVSWVVLRAGEWRPEALERVAAEARVRGWTLTQVGPDWVVSLPRAPAAMSPEIRYWAPDTAQAGGIFGLGVVYTAEGMVTRPPAWGLERLWVRWSRADGSGPVWESQMVHQPPFVVDGVAVSTVPVPVPEEPGSYLLEWGLGSGPRAGSARVEVRAALDAPEARLLPVLPLDACVEVREEGTWLQVTMRTVGWYDEPFTLSARVVDPAGQERARTLGDVEFPPYQPRSHLLTVHGYRLPLTPLPDLQGRWTVRLAAYRWSQPLEAIVPRRFVTPSGEVVEVFTLPLGRCDPRP